MQPASSFIAEALNGSQPDVILNATSFAVASGGTADPLAAFDCPVLQVVLAGIAEESLAGQQPRA